MNKKKINKKTAKVTAVKKIKKSLDLINNPEFLFAVTLICGIIIAFCLGYLYTILNDRIIAGEGIRDTLSYQGKIVNSDGVPPPDGEYSMQFKIFDALTDGNLLWTEIWDNQAHTGQTSNSKVTVNQGVFTVELNSLCRNWVGDCSANGGVTFQQDSFYLQVELDYDGNSTFEEIFTPRKRFTATPYSMNADKLDGRDVSDFVLKSGGTMTGELVVPKITDSSLISCYQFNNNVKNSSSYNGLDGTLQGDAQIISDMLIMDGDGDFVSIADNDLLSFGSGTEDAPFTFSTWINLVDPTNASFVSKGVFNNGDAEYNFGSDSNGKIFIHIFDESLTDCYIGRTYNSQALSSATWLNIAATYDGSGDAGGISIYLNGEAVDDADSSAVCSYVAMENLTAVLNIGKYGTEYANGKIDEVIIYNRELTTAEIRKLYSESKQRYLDVEQITSLYLYLNALDANTEQYESGYLYFDSYFNRIMLSSQAFIPDIMPYKNNLGNDQDYTHFEDSDKILAYDFSDPENGAVDLAGNADGSIGGNADFTNRGFIGYGLIMDENNDYISFNDPGISTTAGTLEMWAKLNNIATSQTNYLAYFSASGTSSLELVKQGTGDLYAKIGDATLADTTYDIPDNSWHHYALTWIGGNYEVFVDGDSVATGTYTSPITTPTTLLLGYGNTASTSLNGAMDSVAIYDRVLTDEELKNHANTAFHDLYINGNLSYGSTHTSLPNLMSLSTSLNEENIFDPVNFKYTSGKALSLGFHEGWGQTTYSHDNNDIYATIYGATWIRDGVYGNGLNFDGVDDYLEIADDSRLNPGYDDFAIEFWINGDALGNNDKTVISKRSGNAGYEIYYDASSDSLRFFIGDGTAAVDSSATAYDFSDGQWHHFMVTFELGMNATIYRDADYWNSSVVDISGVTGSITTTASLLIGKNSGGDYFKGKLDSIIYYNLADKDQFSFYEAFVRVNHSPDFLFVGGTDTPSGVGTLSVLNESSNGHGAIIGMSHSNNTTNYPLVLWTDNGDSNIYNLIYFGSTSLNGDTEYGNLKWDAGNSKFILNKSLEISGDLITNYLKTGGNEFLAFDVIRHTLTSGEATANTFTESWSTTTQDKIVSISAVTLDVSADPDLVSADDWTSNMDCAVTFDGSTITVTEQNTTRWSQDDVVTIYIVYEKIES